MDRPRRRRYSASWMRPGLRVHRSTSVLIVLLYVARETEGIYVPPAAVGAQATAPGASAAENASDSPTQSAASVGSQLKRPSTGPAAPYSGMNYEVGKAICEETGNCADSVGAPRRRLAMSRAIFSTLAQYYFHADMRRLLKRAGYRMAEVVKGIPTADYDLNYYHRKEICLTTFDLINEWGILGPVEADSIEVKFLPAQHRGILTYSESRRSRVEFLKPVQRHAQNFLLPHGCIATTNSTWTAYCTTVDPPCTVGRIDISSSLVPADEPLVPLHLVGNEEFNEKLLADGWEWYEVQDLYEGIPDYPKPLHMSWAYDRCMLHAYFETKAIEKTQYFWMKSRQAFQIMMEQVDGTPYRKMSAFPPPCGGREAKDFAVTVKELESPGNYKAVMSTQIYGDSIMTDPDEIVLKARKPLLPLEDWDPEEDEIDFIELFPDAKPVPLYELESGPYE